MPRPASRYPAQTNIKVNVPARDALNYLRDVVFSANDQSAAIELSLFRITGSATPWLKSGHVWSPAAKGVRGRGKWVRKPGPKKGGTFRKWDRATNRAAKEAGEAFASEGRAA